jgi:hypothetical protein
LETLVRHGVDFIVIGGIAAVAHGSARITADLDITYATDQPNLKALADALGELGATLRGVQEDVPFAADDRTLRHATMFTLDTSAGPLDLLAQPPGAPPYDQLRHEAERIRLDSLSVMVASIDHLVAMKLEAGRPRDLGDVDELDAIRRLRHSAGAR